jgi:hypothetical protein
VVVTIDRKEGRHADRFDVGGGHEMGEWLGGPRPGAAAPRAIVRIAISALWLTAGIGEAAVAADGVTPIGYFNALHSKYAACGYTAMLWRAETIVGEFYDCESDDGTYGKGG